MSGSPYSRTKAGAAASLTAVILTFNDYVLTPLFLGAVVGGLARLLTGLLVAPTEASIIGLILGVGTAVTAVALEWADRDGKLETEGDFLERSRERERTYEQRFPH
jgi:hypothetical protein